MVTPTSVLNGESVDNRPAVGERHATSSFVQGSRIMGFAIVDGVTRRTTKGVLVSNEAKLADPITRIHISGAFYDAPIAETNELRALLVVTASIVAISTELEHVNVVILRVAKTAIAMENDVRKRHIGSAPTDGI